MSILKALPERINSSFREMFAFLASPIVWFLLPWRENVLVKNLANVISTARLVLCIYVDYQIVLASNYQSRLFWLLIVVLLMLSDGFDGALARGLKVESVYGASIDPLADKLLFGGLLVGLCVVFGNPLFSLLAAIVLFIEILNVALGQRLMNLAKALGKVGGSGMWGKLKFGLQCILVLFGWLVPLKVVSLTGSTLLLLLVLPLATMSFLAYKSRVKQYEAELALLN